MTYSIIKNLVYMISSLLVALYGVYNALMFEDWGKGTFFLILGTSSFIVVQCSLIYDRLK